MKLELCLNGRSYNFKNRQVDTDEEWIIGNFLTSDVCCYSSSFKEWIIHGEQPYISSNITRLEKEDDDIILSDQYSEEPDRGPYFRVSKTALVNLLDQ